MKRKSKFVDGFIQFLTYSLLLIGLWTQQDIELFYELGSVHSLVADATTNVAVKLCEKRIFYFAFVIYNKTIKTEPVPILEVLTDCPDERSLTCLLTSFLRDEQKCSGQKVKTVPIICTVDLSWPLIRAILTAFNTESLGKYLERSFQIVTGMASSNHLPTMKDKKTFVHICLAHFMKAISYKAKTVCRSKERSQFITFCCSILANADIYKDFLNICKNMFRILNNRYLSNEVETSIEWLQKRIQQIGQSTVEDVSEIPETAEEVEEIFCNLNSCNLYSVYDLNS